MAESIRFKAVRVILVVRQPHHLLPYGGEGLLLPDRYPPPLQPVDAGKHSNDSRVTT